MMMLPSPKDTLHKAMLYRLLTAVLDNKRLATQLYFKGGTCAAMLGWLDRFSVDLDFDLAKKADKKVFAGILKQVFDDNGFTLVQKAKNELYFVLRYDTPAGARNNLKLSIIKNVVKANKYRAQLLPDINRYAVCQTKETMFANKLVAITNRFKKHKTIAGRDIYDIHAFFSQGFAYNSAVIKERTGKTPNAYFRGLTAFIQKHVTEKLVTEDLNFLLPPARFQAIRRTLKQEVLMYLAKTIES